MKDINTINIPLKSEFNRDIKALKRYRIKKQYLQIFFSIRGSYWRYLNRFNVGGVIICLQRQNTLMVNMFIMYLAYWVITNMQYVKSLSGQKLWAITYTKSKLIRLLTHLKKHRIFWIYSLGIKSGLSINEVLEMWQKVKTQ